MQPGAAQSERPDEGNLKSPGDDLLGSLAEQAGHALQGIEEEKDGPERDQEGKGEEPIDGTGTHSESIVVSAVEPA